MGERLGVEFYVAASSGFRGRIEALAGDWRAAERFTRREYDILERLGDEGHRSTTSANLAVVLCELGDMEEAESLAEAGIRLAADDDLASQVTGRVALARVRSARGRHDGCDPAHAGGGRTVRGMPSRRTRAATHGSRSRRRSARPVRTAEASDAARRALGFFERKGNELAVTSSTQAFLRTLEA